MMMTLAEQYKQRVEFLREQGFPGLVGLFEIYYRQSDLQAELQAGSSTISGWLTGSSLPSRTWETMASKLLAEKKTKKPEKQPVITQDLPESNEGTFMVICPESKSEKVHRILALLGCEVVEI